MAVPVMRAHAHGDYGGACSKPTLADGDVLFMFGNIFYDAAATATPPSGFSSPIYFYSVGAPGDFTQFVSWKLITSASGEPATYDIPETGDHLLMLVSVSGCDTTTPIATTQVDHAAGSDPTYNISSTTIARDSIEFLHAIDFAGGNALHDGAGTFGSITGFTGIQPTPSGPRENALWHRTPATGGAVTYTRPFDPYVGNLARIVVQSPGGGGGGSTSDPLLSAGRRNLRTNAIFRM